MDPRCAAKHPTRPPLPLHPPSPTPCVQCAMSTVTNPTAIYTLRRSACTTLSLLSKDLAILLRLGVSFLSDLLHDLLHALLRFSPAESELAADVISICISLACHYDNSVDDLSVRRLSALLFSECTAAVMLSDTTLNSSMSISLLARLCEMCQSEGISLPFESLPDDFAHRLVSCSTLSAISYSALNVLLKCVMNGILPDRSKELLQAVSSSLPTPRDPDADRMFLTIASYLTETDPDVLLECETLPVVLKTAFMSSLKDLRETASRIIVKISDKPMHAKNLNDAAIFEYIVESLRISDPSTVEVPLLRSSAIALSALAHAIARNDSSEKWVYSLDVVLSVAPHLGAYIHELEPAVRIALQEAPVPLFSNPLIETLVSFAMQMLSHEKDVTQVINSIASLLERLRPDSSSLHAILAIVEGSAISKDHMMCVSVLATKVGDHFLKLIMQTEKGASVEDLVLLGRRLSFVAFETWTSTNKNALETINTFEAAASLYSVDVVSCALDLLTTMLDKGFVVAGAYGLEDRCRMVSWCWQMFPPRVTFKYCLEAEGDGRILKSVSRYCQIISCDEPFGKKLLETHVPVTEDMFLAALATERENGASLVALQLVKRALDLKLLENVCQPELVVRALTGRLTLCSSDALVHPAMEHTSVLRLLSQTCTQSGLIFPKTEIPETLLVSTLTSSEFTFSCEIDCLTFLLITREGNRSTADVAAWEMFSDYYRVSFTLQTALSDMMERILEDESTLQSAMYAILEARDPIAIAECLVYIIGKTGGSSVTLGRSLEQVGALYTSCQSLRDVESALSCDDETRNQSESRNYTKGYPYDRIVKIGISFMILLAGAGCVSDSRCWRTLTRSICDVFVLGADDKCRTQLTDMLLTAALNYLVILTPVLTPRTASSLRFIWQRGVVDSALRMLTTLSADSKISDHLTSNTCSFLTGILNTTDKTTLKFRCRTIIRHLLEDIRWEHILASFPFPADIDSAVRIAKCCVLLKNVLSGDSGRNLKVSRSASHRTMVALAVVSCSVFDVAREAAFDLLGQLLRIGTNVVWKTCLTIHREISRVLLQKFHDHAVNVLTIAEFNYLQQAIRSGHMDKYLTKGRPTLPSKSPSTCYRRQLDQEQSNTDFLDKVRQSLEERKVVLSMKESTAQNTGKQSHFNKTIRQ